MVQTAVHASALMHKRILRLQHLNRDKDQMITQQETDLDSRHQAINQLQCAIACQAHADVEQKKMIALQNQTIAALQAKLNKSQSLQQQAMSGSPQRSCKVCWVAISAVCGATSQCSNQVACTIS